MYTDLAPFNLVEIFVHFLIDGIDPNYNEIPFRLVVVI